MRLGLVLAVVSLFAATSAFAASIFGTAGPDTLRGTPRADVIYGKAGNDRIFGLGGNDRLIGGPGADTISCGPGRDTVVADRLDKIASDCEVVLRPLAVTPKPTPTPKPPPPAAVGTRTNPVPLGQEFALPDGKWKLRINSSTPDATAAVLAENMFNDPPAAGHQFFIVNITTTYVGSGSVQASVASDLSYLGASNVASDASCGVIPDAWDSYVTVFTGGVLTGNICSSVTNGDAASLVLFWSQFLSSRQVFFSVR